MKSFYTALSVLVFSSCGLPCPDSQRIWSDVDLSLYESVPNLYEGTAVTARNWDAVIPENVTDYWELRRADQNHTVVAKAGEKCKAASDVTACILAFDTVRTTDGLATSSGHGEHPHPPRTDPLYIVSNSGDKSALWETFEELKLFIGRIDSKEEAILLAYGSGRYGSNRHKENGAIREVNGEYEMIILFFRGGGPHCISPYREHIRMSPSGSITTLRTQSFPEPRN